MRYLNLTNGDDLQFQPEVDHEVIRFPSGFETTIRMRRCICPVTIVLRVSNANDLFLLAQAVDVLRRGECPEISLFLTFVPNARQDRSTCDGDAFGLKVFANFINSLNFKRVYVFDPHSNVTTALIDRSIEIAGNLFAQEVLQQESRDYMLVSPDLGAYKKISSLAQGLMKPLVVCNKKRNPVTGNIEGITVDRDVKDQILYIVDDILDRGGTFILLTKQLKELGAREVNLVISHGLFTGGLDILWDAGINRIYTTNSQKQKFTHEKLFYFDLKQISFL